MGTSTDYIAQITKLKARIRELEEEVDMLRSVGGGDLEMPHITGSSNEKVKELEIEVKVWKEKYNALKKRKDSEISTPQIESLPPVSGDSEQVLNLQSKISFLESEVEKYKQKRDDLLEYANKLLDELKKYK